MQKPKRVKRKRKPLVREGIYRKLGSAIAERRLACDLSQKDLAEKCKYSRASIGNIETGRHRVWIHDLIRLAIALEVDAIALLQKALEEE